MDINHIKCLLITFSLMALAACGGGGSGGSSEPTVEPSDINPVALTPPPFSINIEREPLIRALFDGELFAPSVDNTSVQLLNNDEPVDIDASLSTPQTVDIQTTRPLSLLTIYSARVSTGVTDLDGRPLASDFLWPFTTRDGIWQAVESIAIGAVEKPGAFANGDTFFAFYQRDNLFSGQNDLFVQRQLDDDNWSAAAVISNNAGDSNVFGNVQAVPLENGDLIAVWQEEAADGTDEIWYNYYDTQNENWNTSLKVLETDGQQYFPQLVSRNGQVIMLFQLEDTVSGALDIMAIHYQATADTWFDETLIANDLDLPGGEGQPSIAMDDSGNAMVVWFDNFRVRARGFDASSTSWEAIESIDDIDAPATYIGTALTADADGNFIAAWSQENLFNTPSIWTNRLTADQGWGTPQIINNSAEGNRPRIVANKHNNAILIWTQDSPLGDNLFFSGFNALQNEWTNGELLENNAQPVNTSQTKLTVDGSGNITAIWNQNREGLFLEMGINYLNPASIWIRRFDATIADDWLTPEAISMIGGDVDRPTLTTNASGELMALWMQVIDGDPNVMRRHFD